VRPGPPAGALTRRSGLARKEAGRLREAVEDMARALSLAPDDATVAKELQEARAAAAAAGESLDDLSTELDAPAPPPPGLGGMNPEQLRAAQEAMRQDPEMVKNMSSVRAAARHGARLTRPDDGEHV